VEQPAPPLKRRSLPLRRGLQEEVVGPLRPHSVGFDAEGEAKVGDRVQGLQNRYHVCRGGCTERAGGLQPP